MGQSRLAGGGGLTRLYSRRTPSVVVVVSFDFPEKLREKTPSCLSLSLSLSRRRNITGVVTGAGAREPPLIILRCYPTHSPTHPLGRVRISSYVSVGFQKPRARPGSLAVTRASTHEREQRECSL